MKIKYIILISILIILISIKIYVANNLYLVSRQIYKNSIQINALKEERNIIKLKIEKLNYKNTIIDPLFNYKEQENKLKKEYEDRNKSKAIILKQKRTTIIKDNKLKSNNNTKELFETLDLDNGDY